MPLNVGDPVYGSVPGAVSGISGPTNELETTPLLISETEEVPVSWHPMTKEELETTAGGAGWRKLRSRLVLLFWLAWLALLGTSIAIILKSPRPTIARLQWWQKSLFYQLQPAFFVEAQTNEPGYIPAVCEQLAYLKSLGVGALIVEGLFYKVSSDVVMNESLGTVPQVQHLTKQSNKVGLKVVLDLCELDLTGSGRANSAGNGTDMPPESSTTVEYTFQFWLEQGVAGFAICDTDAVYSEKTLLAWREMLSEYSSQGEERIVVVKQRGDLLHALNTSGSINGTLVEVVIRSILPPTTHDVSAQEMATAIEAHLQITGRTLWPSWMVGGKVANYSLQKLLLVLIMTLPGSPAVQYGEEISPVEALQNVSMGWLPKGKQNTQNLSGPEQAKVKRSALALFTSLSHSRAREEALLYGTFTLLRFNTTSVSSANSTHTYPPSSPILAFLRSWGCVHFLIVLNMGPEPHGLNPSWVSSLPDTGVFVTSTVMDRIGSTSLDKLELQPQEAIVLKLLDDGSHS